MAIPCFFTTELAHIGSLIELSPAESAHALQSRRLGVGTQVRLINGQGWVADATIDTVSKRQVVARIESTHQVEEPEVRLHVAVAMPKGDRQKTLVDMLTQLGVSEVIPMRTERSIAKLNVNHNEKLRRIATEACKQSQNPWLPNIAETATLSQVLERGGPLFYASKEGQSWRQVTSTSRQATVLIGPEGGFSNEEIMEIERSDAQPLSLGEHILRTETAAIAAVALFKC